MAENKEAQKQRATHWKLKDKELDQEERAQRIARTDQELRREANWFKAVHVLIGVFIGFGLASLYFASQTSSQDWVPVVEVSRDR